MRFGDENGFYELNPFPGCNQIVVSNHSYVYPEKRGKGLGTRYNQLRLEKARLLGYDYIICTVVSTNIAQLKIMKSAGFKELDTFNNKETGNTVTIFGRRLD